MPYKRTGKPPGRPRKKPVVEAGVPVAKPLKKKRSRERRRYFGGSLPTVADAAPRYPALGHARKRRKKHTLMLHPPLQPAERA